KLQHQQVLQGVPSASGVVQLDSSLYVVGDNSAWLYKLNDRYDVIGKELLVEHLTDSILPKISKPDFEAMTIWEIHGKKEILIFGSGSKSPERNTMVRVRFLDSVQRSVHDIAGFYEALLQTEQMEGQDL